MIIHVKKVPIVCRHETKGIIFEWGKKSTSQFYKKMSNKTK
jgi:hypothetical protein